jgi:phage/plasmid-like protein (TIGR03299 family)
MAHEVESMVYVGDTPWHGLGVAVPEEKRLKIHEAIAAAGLDWRVEKRRLFAEGGGEIQAGLLDHYATVRDKDNAVLGVVGRDYEPLQNSEAFEWFQPFLDEELAYIETAGSLKGGTKIWVLAKIENSTLGVGENDPICNYILLSNSHDGSLAVRVGFTPIRVVCNNTLRAAHKSEASRLLKVRHNRNVVEHLEEIRGIMNLAQAEFAAAGDDYRQLAKKKISATMLKDYVITVFGIKEPKRSEVIPKVVNLFESGRGAREAESTLWGAYNAVNEYLNYYRCQTLDNRMDSLWFGESDRIKALALQTALKMAA